MHINPDYRIKGYLDCSSSKLKSQSSLRTSCKRTIKRIYPYKLNNLIQTEKKSYQYVYSNSDKTVLLSEYYKPVFTKLTGSINESKITAISNPLSFQVRNVDLGKKKNNFYLLEGLTMVIKDLTEFWRFGIYYIVNFKIGN